jgi:hypothetical protein
MVIDLRVTHASKKGDIEQTHLSSIQSTRTPDRGDMILLVLMCKTGQK